MKISEIEEKDYQQFIALQNHGWSAETSPVFDKIWTMQGLREYLRTGNGILVALKDGRVVGCLDYSPYYGFEQGKGIITFGLLVHPDCRGKGVGRALLQHFITLAKNMGQRRICIHVTGTNAKAIRFYEHAGFKEECRLKGNLIIHDEAVDDLILSYTL